MKIKEKAPDILLNVHTKIKAAKVVFSRAEIHLNGRAKIKFLIKIVQMGIFSERSAIIDRASEKKCPDGRF